MPAKTLAASLCLLMVPAAALAADQDIGQLQAEIAALKARNAVLEQTCPATAANAPEATAPPESGSVPVFAAAAPPAPATPLPPPPAAAAPPPVPVAQAAPPVPPAAPPQPPSAVPPQLYENTGCDRGFLSGPAPGKWRDAKAWDGIGRGMAMAEVESRLGVEHYDADKRDALQWQYGRCGSGWEGSLTFVDGRVVSVSPPEQ
jgi:hypothetical protein